MATNKRDTEIKKSLLICKHCNKNIQDPRSLPCLHACCAKCLQTLAPGKQKFNCPQCGALTKVPLGGVSAFPVASHLKALAEYVLLFNQNNPSMPCFNKEKEEGHQDAAVKCLECDAYYCKTCDTSHKLSKVARNHTTIKLTDLREEQFLKAAQKKVSPCTNHPDTPVKYLCQDKACNIFICERCTKEKHNKHQCVLLEDIANEYRQNMTRILNEEMTQMQSLLTRLTEVQTALQNNDKNHENNVNLIKERTRKMHKMLVEQEKKLLEEEQKQMDSFRNKCTEVREKAKNAMIPQTQSQPKVGDSGLAQEIQEIREGIETPVPELKFPELWNHSVSVTSQGQPLLERMQEVRKSIPMKCQNALDDSVDSFAVFENMTVAIHCYGDDRPTAVDVRGQDSAKTKAVRQRIEKHSPKAYRVVPMVKDGLEKMVIVSTTADVKILSMDCEDADDLSIDASHKPCAISLDEKCNILYTNHAKPQAIRKKVGHETKTIFTNKDGNEVLDDPWYLTTNINGDIIVSDAVKRSVFIFNEKGELINTYKDFSSGNGNPNGVCTDDNGFIYVSDTNGNCIHRLDNLGTFKDYAVTKEDGLWQPTALQWYKGVLVVGQKNGQIKSFKLETN